MVINNFVVWTHHMHTCLGSGRLGWFRVLALGECCPSECPCTCLLVDTFLFLLYK